MAGLEAGSLDTDLWIPKTKLQGMDHARKKPTAAPAVTIHAYSPPLARTGVYRVGASGELQRESLTLAEELRAEQSLT